MTDIKVDPNFTSLSPEERQQYMKLAESATKLGVSSMGVAAIKALGWLLIGIAAIIFVTTKR